MIRWGLTLNLVMGFLLGGSVATCACTGHPVTAALVGLGFVVSLCFNVAADAHRVALEDRAKEDEE